MMLSAFLRARAEGLEPAGDVIFCALADEEGMSGYAEWLVDEHPELFEGAGHRRVRRIHLPHLGAAFYPIQVAEKQVCTVRPRSVANPATARRRCAAARWQSSRRSCGDSTGSGCRSTSPA